MMNFDVFLIDEYRLTNRKNFWNQKWVLGVGCWIFDILLGFF